MCPISQLKYVPNPAYAIRWHHICRQNRQFQFTRPIKIRSIQCRIDLGEFNKLNPFLSLNSYYKSAQAHVEEIIPNELQSERFSLQLEQVQSIRFDPIWKREVKQTAETQDS